MRHSTRMWCAWSVLALSGLLTAFTMGCQPAPGEEGEEGEEGAGKQDCNCKRGVTGRAIYTTSEGDTRPLAGAVAQLCPSLITYNNACADTVTGAAGRYTFSAVPGDYILRIGNVVAVGGLRISDDNRSEVSVADTLVQTTQLQGVVQKSAWLGFATPKPAASLSVQLQTPKRAPPFEDSAGFIINETATDESGAFSFSTVPLGNYRLKIEGHDPVEIKVDAAGEQRLEPISL